MHKKRRQYPVTGGASTAAESTFHAGLKETGLKLLEGLEWHGVATAEFKKDRRDGEFKLISFKSRFWDSLDLAISCGVDFPFLAVKMAAGEKLAECPDYLVARRFRWLFPDDLMHALTRPASIGPVIADFFRPGTHGNWSWSDINRVSGRPWPRCRLSSRA
jgi:predicted ATP-grasp superfamily ATP-dependent carboligase